MTWALLNWFGYATAWWIWPLAFALATIGLGWLLNLVSRARVAFGLKDHHWYHTVHLTEKRMNFYDTTLNPKVRFAQHAISIDEQRASFQRVGWGAPGVWKKSEPIWFQQLWFAGNHSDVGGSYSENKSRLSDVSLRWMLDAAAAAGLKFDQALLGLYPDPSGPQHDETKSSVFRFASKKLRSMQDDFPLHKSVVKRFVTGPVLHYDVFQLYRPENLRNHKDVKQYYS